LIVGWLLLHPNSLFSHGSHSPCAGSQAALALRDLRRVGARRFAPTTRAFASEYNVPLLPRPFVTWSSFYVLMDYQLTKSNLEHPNQGLYLGGSFMTVPESMNVYARYFEVTL
jgi:hypothetical protein